jgi:hypothetical protein
MKQWLPVSDTELKAFIGLLILAGVSRAKLEPLCDLWSVERGRPIFAAVMRINRFKAILQYLRFDNKNTREIRRATDKLAAIRDVWQIFVAQLPKMITPGSDITVDEQLVPFRGKCPFRQYIPSKPAKYGIKIWWACDAQTSYPLMGDVYLGRQTGDARAVNLGSSVVMNLTSRWLHSGRNIVMDNFFTSVQLAEELMTKNTTLVGTIRRNKPDIPDELTVKTGRSEKSSLFTFDDKITLVSYVPRKGKNVTLLSTMHHDDKVEGEDRKPHIILHYNECKSGVDNMDKLVGTFSCRRKIDRWPMTVFFNMIDVAGVGALVIWLYNNPGVNSARSRRNFLMSLGESLAAEHIHMRLQNPRAIQKHARHALATLGYLKASTDQPNTETHTKQRCELCPRNSDRKVRQQCSKCGRKVCNEHACLSCDDCELQP